ncbi:GNAT family N-acetyltransferase [Alicyclobacillus fodiniaquatilis]|jgi:RimJ/RimL family protein N-acetyltransferase|uniref:GNAT family N-acetyltransferase n=1 Tax=Alicyclobacillus fodiniaquatilis TaxID=1661150 RepID=A0ABW4JMR2_9BACL
MLETPRLLFRPYTWDDFQFYVDLWQDPDVVRHIGDGQVRSKTSLKTNYPYWLAKSALGRGVLLMVHKATQRPIGHAGLVPQEVAGSMELEVGYWLAKRYWGHGFATEAASLFRDIGFTAFKRDRLISIIQPANGASIHVAEKIGMQFEQCTQFHQQLVHIYSMIQNHDAVD